MVCRTRCFLIFEHARPVDIAGRGAPADRLPIVLGCDAAGFDQDGNEVIVYPVIANPDAGMGDETLDPDRALLSERHDGAFAEYLTVPTRNLVPKPAWLSFDEAACLPVAWTTAYRMLFTHAKITAGARVLVQGSGRRRCVCGHPPRFRRGGGCIRNQPLRSQTADCDFLGRA